MPNNTQFEIILPQDKELIRRLNLKLIEYKKRYDEGGRISTQCKVIILSRLLENGKVSLEFSEFSKEIKCDIALFDRAYWVIKDYCETGGKKVCGGTGLPV